MAGKQLRRTFMTLESNDLLTERLAIMFFVLFQRLLLEHQACAFDGALPSSESTSASLTKTGGEQYTAASFFDPYIAILPDVSTPVTLETDLVRGYLAGTLLLDSVCAKRSKLEAEFELLSGNLGVFEHWPIHPSLDNFVWADATFWSRVLSFQTQWGEAQGDGQSSDQQVDDLHMVPFLDFANHADQPNIRWQVDPDGLRVWSKEALLDRLSKVKSESNVGNEAKKDHLEHHDHAHDLEVFLSYGNKPNTELLFLYGFTLHDNPTQFLTLPMPMDEDDPYYMPKAHTLMRLGIPPRIVVYLNPEDGSGDLVEFCKGLWVAQDSQYLLWIYALNEEDGLGALFEEAASKVCMTMNDQDDSGDIEEADLVDEDTIGRLLLTIEGLRIVSKELLRMTVPKLNIYPVLILRSLVLLAGRVEYYIARIMETGDKVQRVEDVEIVRAINYDAETQNISGLKSSSPTGSTVVPASSRLCHNIGECLVPTLLEPDQEHPITSRQLEVEVQTSSLVATMKNYRTEEMNLLVQIGNILGDAQTHCLEESDFIRTYLSQMQIQDQDQDQDQETR
ncbi:hypothetical protein EDD11_000441 [Mortierella claussenii]|nr:hypothetical protein EDD11_000441 [Mortierella claussenii]